VPATYSFAAAWELPAPVGEVAATVVDLEHYPEWWPQVRAVASLGPDTAWVRCRSVLPYTLDLVLDATSRTPPDLEVAISGDLTGFARFSLRPTDAGTHLDFRQEVEVQGALAVASYALRPVLAWNHDRMMAGCRDGLSRRLAPQAA
jgi:hypothetical protein